VERKSDPQRSLGWRTGAGLAALLVAGAGTTGTAGARDDRVVPHAIVCACMCVKKGDNTGNVYNFAAPSGDPTQCKKLEGVKCNPVDADGHPQEGFTLKECLAETGTPTIRRGGAGATAPEKAATPTKPPAPPGPGYIWVDDHWERPRAK
jgi:hypothetical protein